MAGRFVKFTGAYASMDETEKKYIPRGGISIRVDAIIGFYDHTILTANQKIRVVETYEEIKRKLED